MVYTVSVPLQNQQIAATQGPIQQNFAFINSSMQDNHTFNGNPIAGEPNGSHQKLEFPNQVADLAVLPGGISAVQYAKDGNLYNYNAANGKGSVSGVTITDNKVLDTSATTIAILPNDCIGTVVFQFSGGQSSFGYNFFTKAGNLYTERVNVSSSSVVTGTPYLVPQLAGNLNLQASLKTSSSATEYKIIYWPV
jgi:hypothetical protein